MSVKTWFCSNCMEEIELPPSDGALHYQTLVLEIHHARMCKKRWAPPKERMSPCYQRAEAHKEVTRPETHLPDSRPSGGGGGEEGPKMA